MSYDAIQHPNPKYLGFCQTVPFKKGDVVKIRKGTPVFRSGEVVLAKRDYDITVHHTMTGQCATGYALVRYHGRSSVTIDDDIVLFPWRNPTIRWAGSGGYWCECDINYLLPESELPTTPLQPAYEKFVAVAVKVSELSSNTEFSRFVYNKFCHWAEFSTDVPALVRTVQELRATAINDVTRTQCDLVLAEMQAA